jgi:AraC-like DNA-binding protein
MQVARINLIDWHVVGQQPFARCAKSRQTEECAHRTMPGMDREHYRVPGAVRADDAPFRTGERSFTRRFREATGMAPSGIRAHAASRRAKQMLESGEEPVEGIANEVGYEDAALFSGCSAARSGSPSAVPPAVRQSAASLTSGTALKLRRLRP